MTQNNLKKSFDKGIVMEAGTHSELLNHNGLYRKLNDMQFDFGAITQSPVVEDVQNDLSS